MPTTAADPANATSTQINRGDIFWIGPDDSRAAASAYSHPHVVVQDDVFNHSRISTVVLAGLRFQQASFFRR